MRGFTAENLGEYPPACSGRGPTALTRLGDTVYWAADGRLYSKRAGSALNSSGGTGKPWGLAALGGKLYASRPDCATAVTNDPVNGTNCNLVEVNPATDQVIRTVADVCGFGVTADPSNGTLTVATRDGRVVAVRSDGSTAPLLDGLAPDPAVTIDWSPDGRRLFAARQSGAVFSWERASGQQRPVQSANGNALAAGNTNVNMPGSLLVGTKAGAVRAFAIDAGAPSGDVAASNEAAGALLAAPEGVYVALRTELWLLRGKFTPPPPPTTTPPPVTAPPTTIGRPPPATIPKAVVAPPPPQAPPPPPPPAPPVPPLATATQVVAQPSAVANPAIVPGESEREAALRLAATGQPAPTPPYLLWLALAAVVCAGGFGAGSTTRRARAWARTY
jgi:hypothetical protein